MTEPTQPPEVLYRFFDENGLNTLTDGTLKLTPPNEFNDPFEIMPALPKQDYRDDIVRKCFMSETGMLFKTHIQNYRSKSHYRKWVDSTQIPHKHHLPNKLKDVRELLREQVSQHIGIVCFSAYTLEQLSVDSAIPHWSHYAKNHTGLCIGFNGRHSLFQAWHKRGLLFGVKYTPERPTIELYDFSDDSDTALSKVLKRWASHKLDTWKGECEWRLMHPLSSNHGLPVVSRTHDGRTLYLRKLWTKDGSQADQSRQAAIIKYVVLGAKVSTTFKASVISTLNHNHFKHVDLYQAELDEYDFKLRLNLLRQRTPSGDLLT